PSSNSPIPWWRPRRELSTFERPDSPAPVHRTPCDVWRRVAGGTAVQAEEQGSVKFWTRRRAADTFEDVLARCLAQIEDGGASVESCVAAHPRHAERL